MLFNKKLFIFLLIFIKFIFPDQRNYTWTYEKKMLKPGESEFEIYFINEFPEHNILENENNTTLKLQYEFELGMTDDLEVAFYNTFIQSPSGSLEFDQYKLRFKYNIFKKHNNWTPLLYTELKGNLDFTKYTIEQKLIFTHYFNNINFSFNPIIEFENEKDGDTWNREIETELALGVSYQFEKLISLGIDIKSNEYATYIGPVFAHGGEDKYWTFGLARKINGSDEKPSMIIRSIMGFHF